MPSPYTDAQRAQVFSRLMAEIDRKPPPAPQFPQMHTPEMIERNYNRMQNENRLGQAVLATGNRELSPLGQTLAKSNPSKYLQDLAEQEQVRRYQQWQADSAAQPRNQASVLQRTLDMMQPDQTKYRNFPGGILTKMANDANMVDNMSGMLNSFQDNYTQRIGSGTMPGFVENWGNWFNNNFDTFSTIAGKDAANWWAQWRMMFTIENRNEMFGATLQPNEKKAWDEAEQMHPGMGSREIKRRIGQLRDAAARAANRRAQTYVAAGMDPTVAQSLGYGGDQTSQDSTGRITIDSSKRTVPREVTEPYEVDVGEFKVKVLPD